MAVAWGVNQLRKDDGWDHGGICGDGKKRSVLVVVVTRWMGFTMWGRRTSGYPQVHLSKWEAGCHPERWKRS